MFYLISIIGSGRVGASIAFLCVANALDNVLLLNRTKNKAIGESMDIANAIPPTSKFSIRGTDDYSELSGSDIIVIAASRGNYRKNRTENINSQVDMIKEIAEKHNLAIIEDSAHAHGATYKRKKAGTFDKIGVFSFYPDKIMASSDGGMIVTDDYEIYQKLLLLRNVGRSEIGKYDFSSLPVRV